LHGSFLLDLLEQLCRAASGLNRRNDIGIGAATADVAAHAFTDRVVILTTGLFEQGRGRHYLSRRAITALKSVMLKKGSLYRMQFTIFGQTFNRCNLIALMHDGKCEAGVHAASVHMHRASSALTVIASLFGAGKLKIFTERVQQRDAGFKLETVFLAVDFQRYRYRP